MRQARWQPQGPLPSLCDPACGAGVFLVSALDRLCAWIVRRHGGRPADGWVRAWLREALFGVDLDPGAVRAARRALRERAVHWDPACAELDLSRNIVLGNSLVLPGDVPAAWRPVDIARLFSSAPQAGLFDLVVGNPPFVDAAEMTRSAPALRRHLASRYEAATGNWDLYCVFIERALQLLGEDGRLGLIVPNKLLSAAYANDARRLLAQRDLVLLRDYSQVRLFDASVYPLVIIARQRARRRASLRLEVVAGPVDQTRVVWSRTEEGEAARRHAREGWSPLFTATHVKAGAVALRPLGELVEVWGAATVADAYRLRPLVRECDGCPEGRCFHLINTGTLDPYQLLWGRRQLRYLGGTYLKPCVEGDALTALLPRRAEQARGSKIVVAGLSRRLECAFDSGGVLAGKSTSLIVLGERSGPLVTYALLLGLLNSAPASVMLRRQFGGLALAGGYQRVGPPQLRQLLVPDPARIPGRVRRRIGAAAERLTRLGQEVGGDVEGAPWRRLTTQIDEAAWPLFGLASGRVPEAGSRGDLDGLDGRE